MVNEQSMMEMFKQTNVKQASHDNKLEDMGKLEAAIELYKRKKIENQEPLVWEISTNENGNGQTFEIALGVNANYYFQYKYHNVLDLRNSEVHIKDPKLGAYTLDFMVNVFLDPLNGELQQYALSPDMHGLISLKKGSGVKSNGLVQLFDYNNNSCMHVKKTEGIIGVEENY